MNHTHVEQPVVRPVSQHHGLRAWLARHQLLAFFGLTYLISWSIWGVEPLLAMVDQRSARWFSFLASFGPTLAAMALTTVVQRERAPLPHQVRRFWVVGLVLAATLLVNLSLLGELWSGSFTVFTVVLLLIITLLPAWIFWNAFSARRGLRELLQSLVAWRARPRWYAAALLLPLLVSLGGLGVLVLLGQPLPPFPRTEPLAGLPTLLLITFMATLFYGGPLGEEAGWRGYALPRLQAQFSPLVASLILSLAWGLWHLPLHLMGFYQGVFPDGLPGILLRIVSSVPLAILFTWLYNRSRGNLWLVVLLHTAVNNSAGFWLPVTPGVYLAMPLLVLVLMFTDRMWQRLPAEGLRQGYW